MAGAPGYDLASMHTYIRTQFSKPRPGECSDCARLRAELKPILQSLIGYVKIGDAGVAELQESHRDTSTYEMGLPPTMPEEHRKRFTIAAANTHDLTIRDGRDDSTLPPSLQALMSKPTNERESVGGSMLATHTTRTALRRDYRS